MIYCYPPTAFKETQIRHKSVVLSPSNTRSRLRKIPSTQSPLVVSARYTIRTGYTHDWYSHAGVACVSQIITSTNRPLVARLGRSPLRAPVACHTPRKTPHNLHWHCTVKHTMCRDLPVSHIYNWAGWGGVDNGADQSTRQWKMPASVLRITVRANNIKPGLLHSHSWPICLKFSEDICSSMCPSQPNARSLSPFINYSSFYVQAEVNIYERPVGKKVWLHWRWMIPDCSVSNRTLWRLTLKLITVDYNLNFIPAVDFNVCMGHGFWKKWGKNTHER